MRAALDVIRGRWKPSILFVLSTGPARFGDIQSRLAGVTAQALTVQLRQLEADGVLLRSYRIVPDRDRVVTFVPSRRVAPVVPNVHPKSELEF